MLTRGATQTMIQEETGAGKFVFMCTGANNEPMFISYAASQM